MMLNRSFAIHQFWMCGVLIFLSKLLTDYIDSGKIKNTLDI